MTQYESFISEIRKNYEARNKFLKTAFAIPNAEVIEWMVQFSPIVEIGAGTGYWAKLLSEAGAQVDAYDIAPIGSGIPNEYVLMSESHYDVKVGGTEAVELHPQSTLFLCWPPYDTPMAWATLKSYAGNRLIYIGEGHGGCTGDDQFHNLLDAEWEESYPPVEIESFEGVHDRIRLFERK